MSIQKLKVILSQKTEKELVTEIAGLYKRFSVVKDYYDAQISSESLTDVLKKYKSIILNEFLPKHGFGDAKLSVARKVVMDYKKLIGISESLVDLAIYYVEVGVLFTNQFGDIDEAFYNSMESMYLQALKWMKELGLQAHFQQRAKAICNDTYGIGWGFHDGLCETYSNFFEEE